MTPDPSSSDSSSTSPTPPLVPQLTPGVPKPTNKADGNDITVTGTVDYADIEGGCTVLRVSSNVTYELMGGDRNVLKHGARVKVTGKVLADMATICQVGPVLQVTSSQPA